MTVCVAAICDSDDSPCVIGASDRMLTSGIVQFEPPIPKIVPVTSSIVIMMAGDSALQQTLCAAVRRDAAAFEQNRPEEALLVTSVAEQYAYHFQQYRRKAAERDVLAPLGLTTESFLATQQQLAPDLVLRLTSRLWDYQVEDVAAIITGLDPTGAHLYTCHQGMVSCQDGIGFAAIGSGAWHANTYLMFERHNPAAPFPDTLLRVLAAKRRAEVSPGVGSDTDMFLIPRTGGYFTLNEDITNELNDIYEQMVVGEHLVALDSFKKVNRYVEELTAPLPDESDPADGDGDPDADAPEPPH